MPLTEKGQKIMSHMKGQYGEKKGEQVFYASKNAGKIEGVDEGDDASSAWAAREWRKQNHPEPPPPTGIKGLIHRTFNRPDPLSHHELEKKHMKVAQTHKDVDDPNKVYPLGAVFGANHPPHNDAAADTGEIAGKAVQVLPEEVTAAEINRRNREYWRSAGGEQT